MGRTSEIVKILDCRFLILDLKLIFDIAIDIDITIDSDIDN